MNLKDINEQAGELVTHAREYADTLYQAGMVQIAKKISTVTSAVFSVFITATLLLFVILFAGIAAAWWLGGLLQSRAAGFLLVAGFFLLLALLIGLLQKKRIFPFIRNYIIRKMYEQDHQDIRRPAANGTGA